MQSTTNLRAPAGDAIKLFFFFFVLLFHAAWLFKAGEGLTEEQMPTPLTRWLLKMSQQWGAFAGFGLAAITAFLRGWKPCGTPKKYLQQAGMLGLGWVLCSVLWAWHAQQPVTLEWEIYPLLGLSFLLSEVWRRLSQDQDWGWMTWVLVSCVLLLAPWPRPSPGAEVVDWPVFPWVFWVCAAYGLGWGRSLHSTPFRENIITLCLGGFCLLTLFGTSHSLKVSLGEAWSESYFFGNRSLSVLRAGAWLGLSLWIGFHPRWLTPRGIPLGISRFFGASYFLHLILAFSLGEILRASGTLSRPWLYDGALVSLILGTELGARLLGKVFTRLHLLNLFKNPPPQTRVSSNPGFENLPGRTVD